MTELVPAGGELTPAPQLVVGVLVPSPGECGNCGRSVVQHGRFTCGELDDIAERIAYWRRPWLLRWRR